MSENALFDVFEQDEPSAIVDLPTDGPAVRKAVSDMTM